MHPIQLRGGQNRGCLHELGFWALGGRGHWHSGASWAQGPSCGSSGWLCIQANKSIAEESLSCCQKLVVALKDIFCAPMGEEGRVLPAGGERGQSRGTTQLEEACTMSKPSPLHTTSQVTGTVRDRPWVGLRQLWEAHRTGANTPM